MAIPLNTPQTSGNLHLQTPPPPLVIPLSLLLPFPPPQKPFLPPLCQTTLFPPEQWVSRNERPDLPSDTVSVRKWREGGGDVDLPRWRRSGLCHEARLGQQALLHFWAGWQEGGGRRGGAGGGVRWSVFFFSPLARGKTNRLSVVAFFLPLLPIGLWWGGRGAICYCLTFRYSLGIYSRVGK